MGVFADDLAEKGVVDPAVKGNVDRIRPVRIGLVADHDAVFGSAFSAEEAVVFKTRRDADQIAAVRLLRKRPVEDDVEGGSGV